jgi:hypothetical protein
MGDFKGESRDSRLRSCRNPYPRAIGLTCARAPGTGISNFGFR